MMRFVTDHARLPRQRPGQSMRARRSRQWFVMRDWRYAVRVVDITPAWMGGANDLGGSARVKDSEHPGPLPPPIRGAGHFGENA